MKPKGKDKPKHDSPLNLREIKELLEMVEEKGFAEFELEAGGMHLRVRREAQQPLLPSHGPVIAYEPVAIPAQLAPVPMAAPSPVADPPAAAPAPAAPPTPKAAEENLSTVKSPIVGTFYESSAPGSPPLARVGQTVQKGQVLCIVEAMKLMNEIESDVAGEVVQCLVKNGQPVEYGQPLFAIRPA